MRVYLLLLLLCTLHILIADSKVLPKRLPKFCRRFHPEYEACTTNVLRKWGPYLLKGVPELNFPKLHPLHMPLFLINRTASPTVSVFASVKNIELWGFEKLDLENFNFNTKTLSGDIFLNMPYLKVDYDFDVSGTLLSLILNNTGHFQGDFRNLGIFFNFALSPVERRGIKYYEFEYFKGSGTIEDGHISLSTNNSDTQLLLDGIANFYNINPKIIMDAIQPVYDESMQVFFKTLVDPILEAIPARELLPE